MTNLPPSEGDAAATEFAVDGMTCNGCARHVLEAIQSVEGVRSASVSLEEKRARVRWRDGALRNTSAVMRAVEAAGFAAKEVTASVAGASRREGAWSGAALIGWLATAALMIGEWVFQLGDAAWYRWLALALASMVQFGPGRQFYRGAWTQLKVGRSNMDTLVALGSTTAFAYSVWALLAGQGAHLYFMEAAAIISLISLGHWMEAGVSARASEALKALMQLAPATARRRGVDGVEREVSVAELRPGDVVMLRSGEALPTDGEVIEGDSAVDESMLTGESMPVEKRAGSKVYAGTMVQGGRLVVRVTLTGEHTALAHIVAAVERAQSSRANIQRLGDRVSDVFVPVVVMIAIGAALWWGFFPEEARALTERLGGYLWMAHPPAGVLAGAVIAAASVLIIACPCAMGLATPAAIMAGANAAARRGILIRDGVALEKAGGITAVVFDKTGTLTRGRPVVVQRFHPERGEFGPAVADVLASSLAALSAHPLSRALAVMKDERFALEEFSEVSGCGLTARLRWNGEGPRGVRMGSLRWLAENGVNAEAVAGFAGSAMSQGATIVGLAVEGCLVAAYALRDELKPGAREMVRQFAAAGGGKGTGVYIVSGDAERTVRAVAADLGLEQVARHGVFAAVPPERKATIVRELQQRGERVAFVGDGINDAPALEQADLGIAVCQASDVAREAADVVLLRSEIDAIPESLALARATLRTIRQNLFWAFFYNAAGVPLAALGFMSPVLCAVAMGVSDLVVIGNALRLLRWRP